MPRAEEQEGRSGKRKQAQVREPAERGDTDEDRELDEELEDEEGQVPAPGRTGRYE